MAEQSAVSQDAGGILTLVAQLAGQFDGDPASRRESLRLLEALRPWLNSEQSALLDRAIRLMRIADAVRILDQEGG